MANPGRGDGCWVAVVELSKGVKTQKARQSVFMSRLAAQREKMARWRISMRRIICIGGVFLVAILVMKSAHAEEAVVAMQEDDIACVDINDYDSLKAEFDKTGVISMTNQGFALLAITGQCIVLYKGDEKKVSLPGMIGWLDVFHGRFPKYLVRTEGGRKAYWTRAKFEFLN